MQHTKLLSIIIAAAISAGSIFTMTASAAVKGDINGDETASSDDLELLQGYILGKNSLTKEQSQAADLNGDGKTNVYDVTALRKVILSSDRSIKFKGLTDRIETGYKDALKNLGANEGGCAVTSSEELSAALSPYFSDDIVNRYLEKYTSDYFSQSVLLLKPVYLDPRNYSRRTISTAACGCSSSYAGTYTTTKDVTIYLNIRSEHSASSESIGRIPPNAEIPVTYGNGKWAHVTYDGVSGYGNMDYMQKIAEPAEVYAFTHDIAFDSIKYSGGTVKVSASEFKPASQLKFVPAVILQATISKKDFYANDTAWDVKITEAPTSKYNYPLAQARLDTVGWDLKAAFNSAASTTYYGQTADMPQDTSKSLEWYAEFGFKNGKGNCYVMAAMFCEMARLLGYDAHLISGRVPLMAGGYGPHSWTEVNIDGTVYVCDPDFAQETQRNGYMITYGQSGTWQYVKDVVMD